MPADTHEGRSDAWTLTYGTHYTQLAAIATRVVFMVVSEFVKTGHTLMCLCPPPYLVSRPSGVCSQITLWISSWKHTSTVY